MSKLKNKTALITGGTTGIGFATAELFRNEGAHVIITGQNKDRVQEASAKLGDSVLCLQSDTADLSQIDHLAQIIQNQYKSIDIIFANAGIAQFKPFTEVTPELYDKIFNINVRGLFFTIQKLTPLINENGSIILNASVAGRLGIEMASVYSATKASVRSLGRSLASTLADKHIRVNTVSPGPIETPIFGKMGLPAENMDDFTKETIKKVALKRFGQANEVAQAVLFLASNDSSYINGIELFVDGGFVEL